MLHSKMLTPALMNSATTSISINKLLVVLF